MDTLMSVDGERAPRARPFETQIGDDNFDFVTVAFDDAKVTGAQVCMAAGLHPVEDYVVLPATPTAFSSRAWRWNGRMRS